LIASYAQGAILLCIVGQELHDHQSPGCRSRKSNEVLRGRIGVRNRFSRRSGAGVRGLRRNFSQAGLRNAGREDLADLAVE
jgi:hypothetical protein